MYKELEKVDENNTKFNHSVFIVFIDGGDNESGNLDSRHVISSALTVRKNVSNLQIFSMELGNSNKSFFKQIAVESGFAHIQLEKIQDLGKFEQHVASLVKRYYCSKAF